MRRRSGTDATTPAPQEHQPEEGGTGRMSETSVVIDRVQPGEPAADADGVPGRYVHIMPPWVLRMFGHIPPQVIARWRERGWLTAPGGRTCVGTGRRFDWQTAVPQVRWLNGLYRYGKQLDREDVAAGWRLRDGQGTHALRVVGGRWEPYRIGDPLPMGHVFFVAAVAGDQTVAI